MEINKQDKIKVLIDLWNIPSFGFSYLFREKQNWIWAEKKITRYTTVFMLSILVAQFFIISSNNPIILLSVGIFILFIVLILYATKYCLPSILTRKFRNKRKFDSDILISFLDNFLDETEGKSGLEKFSFKIWEISLFIRPLSFRYIWWWTLLFGVIFVELRYLQDNQFIFNFRLISVEKFIYFGKDLVIALITSILVYIATNIIRELLSLREQYVEGTAEMGQLRRRIIDSVKNHNIIKKGIEDSGSILSTMLLHLERHKNISIFIENLKHKGRSIEEQGKDFSKNLNNQLTIIQNHFTLLDEKKFESCLFKTFNEFISNQNTDIEKNIILTRFTTLASIAQGLVESIFPDFKPKENKEIEIYALLIKPPIKFLNYFSEDELRNCNPENIKIIYSEWEKWNEYLDANRTASLSKIKQHRFFVSIKEEKEVIKTRAENAIKGEQDVQGNKLLNSLYELMDINSEDMKASLKHFVKVNESKEPYRKRLKIKEKEFKIYKDLVKKPRNEQSMSIAELIGNHFHYPGCCRILELELNDYLDNLVDSNSNRPYDYFAIREKKEWKLCLETKYDKQSDTADIGLYYRGTPGWKRIQSQLDRVFHITRHGLGKTTIITEY